MVEMIPTEHEEQVTVVEWFDQQYPKYRGRLYAVANAGAGSQRGQAGKMKSEGVRKGVPDLCLPVPAQGFHGLYIEMKRMKGGTLAPEQRDWLDFLGSQGYMAVVCRGANAAIQTLRDYLR